MPNHKNTMCILNIGTSVCTGVKSWANHTDIAQVCRFCSCVQQSPGATLESGGEKLDKRMPPTQPKEVVPATVIRSAAERLKHESQCIMTNRTGYHCKETECRKEGGLCLADPYQSYSRCFGHGWNDGILLSLHFRISSFLPSCKNCSCARLERPSRAAAIDLSALNGQPHGSEPCEMSDKKGKRCNIVECKNEGGRCSVKKKGKTSICYPHTVGKDGVLFSQQFDKKHLCTGCRCLRKDDFPIIRTPEKLYNLDCNMVNRRRNLLCKETECRREGGRCSSVPYNGYARCYPHILTDGKLSRHHFQGSHILPSCTNCLCIDQGRPPSNTVASIAAKSLAGKRKFSEELPTSSEEFLQNTGQSSAVEVVSPYSEGLDHGTPPNSAAKNNLAGKRKLSEELPTSSDEFLPSLERLLSDPEVQSPT
jgi:hypothetical protein